MVIFTKQRLLVFGVLAALFISYGAFLMHKVNLVTADLGRHIKNGEYLFQDPKILTTNFYSYTQPDFPDINHHWGSGIIFHLLDKAGGITLVHVFFMVISLATLGIYLYVAKKQSSWGWAALAGFIAILLLAERTEIRPEAFSYFFAGLFLLFLYKFRDDEQSYKYLYSLPLLQVLWSNTHIFFIMGPLIVGAFLVESLLFRREIFLKLLMIFALTCSATLANPAFIRGAIEPLIILIAFGYRLAENQTVPFMLKFSRDPLLRVYIWVFIITLASFIPAILRERRNFRFVNLFLFAGFSFLAWYQIRNITFFAFVAIPLLAYNLKSTFASINESSVQKFALAFAALLLVSISGSNMLHRFPYWREFGLGLEPGNNNAAAFFKSNGLKGPIFNNYDIGGYLIYHLYPQEKVFVDNRPEAYSVEFFEKLYLPMQQDNELWKQKQDEYGMNAIVFSHTDATPWGQNFLIERIKDRDWAAVYVDQYVIIFLKRNQQNQEVIEKYEVTKDRFRVAIY